MNTPAASRFKYTTIFHVTVMETYIDDYGYKQTRAKVVENPNGKVRRDGSPSMMTETRLATVEEIKKQSMVHGACTELAIDYLVNGDGSFGFHEVAKSAGVMEIFLVDTKRDGAIRWDYIARYIEERAVLDIDLTPLNHHKWTDDDDYKEQNMKKYPRRYLAGVGAKKTAGYASVSEGNSHFTIAKVDIELSKIAPKIAKRGRIAKTLIETGHLEDGSGKKLVAAANKVASVRDIAREEISN